VTVDELLQECKGNMTQTEFARVLGVTQVHVSRLLAGTQRPGRKVIVALMKAFPEKRDVLCHLLVSAPAEWKARA
jgi:plasmid maintenance system antidote protein VapI